MAWGNCGAHLTCFLSLRELCPLSLSVQYLENHHLICFVSVVVWVEIINLVYYSILAGNRKPWFFKTKNYNQLCPPFPLLPSCWLGCGCDCGRWSSHLGRWGKSQGLQKNKVEGIWVPAPHCPPNAYRERDMTLPCSSRHSLRSLWVCSSVPI